MNSAPWTAMWGCSDNTPAALRHVQSQLVASSWLNIIIFSNISCMCAKKQMGFTWQKTRENLVLLTYFEWFYKMSSNILEHFQSMVQRMLKKKPKIHYSCCLSLNIDLCYITSLDPIGYRNQVSEMFYVFQSFHCKKHLLFLTYS